MSRLPVAVQMYTLREFAAKDLLATLEQVAHLGYTGVELAGTFDTPVAQIATTLNNLGLACVSAHVPLFDLKHNLLREIDTYLELNTQYLICPWLAPEERGGAADYKLLADDLNRVGEQCKANGLQLCYHHHDFEFERFNGKYALDILLENSDPTNVQLEADTYWIKAGGEEPAGYLKRWSGRIPLIHVKDMSASDPPTFAEVGTGILNWPYIFEVARDADTQWVIVEQDVCPGNPFDSLAISFKNLNRLLSA